MINIFYEDLPTTITANGTKYKIVTDFRECFPVTISNGNAYTYTNTDVNANANTDANTDINTNTNIYSDAYTHSDTNTNISTNSWWV